MITSLRDSTIQVYIIYSSIGSFYLPFLLITFFYVRIYATVRHATGQTSRGYLSVRPRKSKDPEQDATLFRKLSRACRKIVDNQLKVTEELKTALKTCR